MHEADATIALTIRVPAFMVTALDTIASTSRPAAPTFRPHTRADLVRLALGEFLASRGDPGDAPAPRARVTAYPTRRTTR